MSTIKSSNSTSSALPSTHFWLAVFVAMLFAVLAVLYGEIGTMKFLSDPGGRLGYAIGTGLALAIPIILIIWALILRRASRGKIAIAFSLAWLAGTATTFLQMP